MTAPSERVRLDLWLDIACLFKTRSEAQRACHSGKVAVNDQRAKPHRTVQPGDRLTITRPNGRKQQVLIQSLAGQHIAKAVARTLYEDVTPPPTAAELEVARLGRPRVSRRRRRPGEPSLNPAPDKRQRREARRLKGQ
jgi:ribosome-associated heat shock protein Hsp15